MIIENYLSETLAKVFQKLGYAECFAKVVTSTREDVGHFQCNGAMPLANFAKKPPLAIAEEIVEHIDAEDNFAK
ncbi:arginine--tRNA ligase, partial [Francisella tularensis subsp. holarctica]|nr:arginine--tRNA ligase [Francisella tularensis subsp. holarctica]